MKEKSENCEPRGPGSDRKIRIQDQIVASEAGLAKLRAELVPEPWREKHPHNQVIDLEGTPLKEGWVRSIVKGLSP